jgi:hypothetical protein
MVASVLRALVRDRNLFERAGSLVSVLRAPDGFSADGSVSLGEHSIRLLDFAALYHRVACVTAWQRPNRTGWKPAGPDRSAVAAVLSTATDKSSTLRPLESLTESPFLRRDGEVVETPGYDRKSAILYLPSVTYPRIPKNPNLADARLALRALREPFVDFEWRAGPDRDVPVAAILTLLGRNAIDGATPLFILDSSTRASGKSKTADVIALIATGHAASRSGWPGNEEERGKALGAYALQGAPIIVFDEASPLGGPELNKYLTATDRVSTRPLGKSEIVSVPWRSVLVTTANNTEIHGDTERRVLIARTEPTVSNPEERDGFQHPDLLGWVKAERTRLVVQGLTLLRAYVLAGKPGVGLRPWGSFEAWTRLVAGALVWAGGENVLDARPTMRSEGDPEVAAIRVVMAQWDRLDFSGRGMTVQGLVSLVMGSDDPTWSDVREALEALAPDRTGRAVDVSRLGYVFRRHRGRWIDGRRLMPSAKDHASRRWVVEKRLTDDPDERAAIQS